MTIAQKPEKPSKKKPAAPEVAVQVEEAAPKRVGRPPRPGEFVPFSARIATEAKTRLTQHAVVMGVSVGEILTRLILAQLEPVPDYLLRGTPLGQGLAGRLLDAVQEGCEKVRKIPMATVVSLLVDLLAKNGEQMKGDDATVLGIALHDERDGLARLRRARIELDRLSKLAYETHTPGSSGLLIQAATYQLARKAISRTLSPSTTF